MKYFVIPTFVCAFTMALLVGCENQAADTKTVNIAIQNDSTNDLDLIDLQWQGPNIPGGSIPPGASKTALGMPWPKVEVAKLSFTDEKTRQSNSVDLSFTDINKQIDSGICRTVIIRIVSFQKVAVVKGD